MRSFEVKKTSPLQIIITIITIFRGAGREASVDLKSSDTMETKGEKGEPAKEVTEF